VGGLVRCVSCGEVQWNIRSLTLKTRAPQECRVCGAELRPERRRPGRRLERFARERRDAPKSPNAAI
jgi:hypothetical protein